MPAYSGLRSSRDILSILNLFFLPRPGIRIGFLSVLGPLVLATNLLLLFGSEVVGDVERLELRQYGKIGKDWYVTYLADLLGGLALNHIGNRLAADIKQGLDVQVVGSLWQNVSTLVYRRGRLRGGCVRG